MISGTSFSRAVIFKNTLNRFKWFGILYGAALFLVMPLLIWMELANRKAVMEEYLWVQAANTNILPQFLGNPLEHLLNLAAPIIFGLLIFNYLHKQSASTFFHSLPIKRASLYFQNLSAGLTLIWVPILINGLLVYGVFTFFGVTEGQWYPVNFGSYSPGMETVINNTPKIMPIWQVMGYWLVLNLLMSALFYAFTVFIGMLTGVILLQGALTLIGLVLPLGVYLLLKTSFEKLLYGYPRLYENNIEWLSPLVSYINDNNYRYLFEAWSWYAWYLAVCLLAGAAGLYLYKARPSEAAGETLANKWIRSVFKYGVTACTALTGGIYLSSFNDTSIGALYLGYFLGAVLGYVVADMISYKSFHFYRRWKGMLVFAVVFILILTSIKLDVFGYESRVPGEDSIQAISFSMLNFNGPAEGITGKDNIKRVGLLHQEIIKRKEENKALEKIFRRQPQVVEKRMADTASVPKIMRIEFTYLLETGGKVSRSYTIDVNQYRDFLYPILNSEEAKKLMYGQVFKVKDAEIDQININNDRLNKYVRIYKRDELERVVEALRKDVLNISYETAIEHKVPARAFIEIVTKSGTGKTAAFHLSYYPEFKFLETFLAEQGYYDQLFLKPQEVSSIEVYKLGSNDTVVIKEMEKVKELLNWCRKEDEKMYLMRQRELTVIDENSNAKPVGFPEYYGKIILANGKSIFVIFDGSPYAIITIESGSGL